jgi:nicotinamide mononucleotide adenylyltransferase
MFYSYISTAIILVLTYSSSLLIESVFIEMAKDFVEATNSFQILGGYFSPVSDAYNKPGLAPADHRVRMCELALDHSDWLMVDPWESQQLTFQRTALVLDHFSERLNGTFIIEYVIALFIFGYINNVR